MGIEVLGVWGTLEGSSVPTIPKDFCVTLFKTPASFPCLQHGDEVTWPTREREGMLYVK